MQKSLIEKLRVSRPEKKLQPISLKDLRIKKLPVNNIQADRLITHIIVLGLLLGMFTFGGIRLSQPQLSAPQHTPPQQSTESVTTPDNGRPLTLPERLNNQTNILLPKSAPHTIIPDRSVPEVEAIQTYTVQPGDTIYGIALEFDLAPETILWANGSLEDNPDLLRLGQELTILPVDGVYHQVGGDDTLESIAATYKVETEVIINYHLNEFAPENPVIYRGQWLVIPNGLKPYIPKFVSSVAVNAPDGALTGTGNFRWPTSGSVTQEFWGGHRALDIGAWIGAPIYAADAGYVVAAQWDDTGYGRMIIIDHGNGFKTLYGHLNVLFVSVGDEVTAGQQIAEMGSTGNSTGPHLHFEMIKDGVKRNPWGFLP